MHLPIKAVTVYACKFTKGSVIMQNVNVWENCALHKNFTYYAGFCHPIYYAQNYAGIIGSSLIQSLS